VAKLRYFQEHADTCAVCMEDTLDRLACGHAIHVDACMGFLPRAVCPYCRADIAVGASVTQEARDAMCARILDQRQRDHAAYMREMRALQDTYPDVMPDAMLHELSQRYNC